MSDEYIGGGKCDWRWRRWRVIGDGEVIGARLAVSLGFAWLREAGASVRNRAHSYASGQAALGTAHARGSCTE